MQSISKEYLFLFNTLSDAADSLTQLRASLMDAQRQAEELFLQRTDGCPPSTPL